MHSALTLKRYKSLWSSYKKNHRLVNCTNEPLQIPERNKKGFLQKTQTIYYELIMVKAQFLKIPQEIRFFDTYRMFVTYSITLFNKSK